MMMMIMTSLLSIIRRIRFDKMWKQLRDYFIYLRRGKRDGNCFSLLLSFPLSSDCNCFKKKCYFTFQKENHPWVSPARFPVLELHLRPLKKKSLPPVQGQPKLCSIPHSDSVCRVLQAYTLYYAPWSVKNIG